MNVYIDCGAYNGDTIDCERLFNFNADYKIAFEPNPKFFAELSQKKIDELHNAVVWTSEDIIDFYVDESPTPLGSTVMKSKADRMTTTKYQMHSIDFSQFINETCQRLKPTKVLVKLDIEGAEFPVLEKLIKDKTIHLIDKIYCEFHPNKASEYTTEDKDNLIKQVQNLGVEIEEWT